MKNISRREFLQIAGLSGGGLLVKINFPLEMSHFRTEVFHSLLLTIHPDDTIKFRLPKLEMGQGVATGFCAIFAEEMGLDFYHVKVEQAPLDSGFDDILQGVSGGSGSVQGAWKPLRQAAAQLRTLFVEAAARQWKVERDECEIAQSLVVHFPSGRKWSLGSLVAGVNAIRDLQLPVSVKDAAKYRFIGKAVPKIWVNEIVRGKLNYSMDFSMPDMLFASIERCPFFMGRVAIFDDTKARKINGVVDVFKIDRIIGDAYSENNSPSYRYVVQEGIVVVGTSSWATIQGRKALEISWEPGEFGSYSLPESMESDIRQIGERNDVISVQSGDLGKLFESGDILSRTYEIGFQAHASMEPLAAVANCSEDRCEIWTGHQFGKRIVEQASRLFGFAAEKITVNILPAGGAFGRRWEADFAIEAIFASMKIRRPVKLFWTREDEIAHDYFHPFERHKHDIAFDAHGQAVAWKCRIHSCDNMPGGFWNPYFAHIANQTVTLASLNSPLQIGAWRSVAHHRHVFSLECVMDEMARYVGKDPLHYRIEMLEKSLPIHRDKQAIARIIRLLKVVAESGYWNGMKGQGIAVTQLRGSCVILADVEITDNERKIEKLTAFVDCGLIVNPSQVTGQIEGGMIWGLQAALHGGIQIKDGKVVQSNFHDYQLPRINEIPAMEVKLIDGDSDSPLGVGELGVPGVAPAIANAISSLGLKAPSTIPF